MLSDSTPPNDRRLGDAAVQAVLQTTQIDHERRISRLEENTERQREAFDKRMQQYAQDIDQKFDKISGQYTRLIIWSAGACLSFFSASVAIVLDLFLRK